MHFKQVLAAVQRVKRQCFPSFKTQREHIKMKSNNKKPSSYSTLSQAISCSAATLIGLEVLPPGK